MKARYWLLPVLMLIGSWIHTLICEQLPQNNKLLLALPTLLLFALTALILNRTCTRGTVLISAAGLLIFCLVLTCLDLLLAIGVGSQQFSLALAYLWEFLFSPYLVLFTSRPLFYLLPALVPFAWIPFCKQA